MSQSQRILVAETGISDIATTKLVLERGDDVVLYDGNTALKKEDIKEKFDKNAEVNVVLGETKRPNLLGVELCIIGPGIPLDSLLVSTVDDVKIPTLGETGLAYQCGLGKLAAITGTDGKTTTTTPTGEVLKTRHEEIFVIRNIGGPYTSKASEMTEDPVTVAEVSSSQLETIMDFKPNVSAILNIVLNHLNRRGTVENHIRVKERITLGQTKEDAAVLNYDDSALREFGQNPEPKPRVVQFSGRETLKDDFCMDGNNTVYCQSGRRTVVVNVHDMQFPGHHNYENAMAVAAIALEMGVSMSDTTRVAEGFHSMEHRIEFVKERIGARYYNNSKGTNSDTTIQALRTMPGPTLLTAEGYDKNSEYDERVPEFEGKVKYLAPIGQAKDKIVECAKKYGFAEIMYAKDMQEAVQVCAVYVDTGDYVLLNPACASWDMPKNYEGRRRVFKGRVMALQEVNAYGGKGVDGSRTLWPDETTGRGRGPGGAADTKEKEEDEAFL